MAARLPYVEREQMPTEVQATYDLVSKRGVRGLNFYRLMVHHAPSAAANFTHRFNEALGTELEVMAPPVHRRLDLDRAAHPLTRIRGSVPPSPRTRIGHGSAQRATLSQDECSSPEPTTTTSAESIPAEPSSPRSPLKPERLDIVQYGLRMQERRGVDLADVAGAVDQEHLEHVRELAARLAARPVDGRSARPGRSPRRAASAPAPSAW